MNYSGARSPRRVHGLDQLRGISIILMVIYHTMYDIVYIAGIDIPFFHTIYASLLQKYIAGSFILLAGIVCQYSRANIKRGFIVLGFGLLITGVTVIFMPQEAIYFGVLHLLGTAMILFGMLKNKLERLPAFWGILFSLVLLLLTLRIPYGGIGISERYSVALPQMLYQTPFLFPFGFASAGFVSSDFFPIFPWFFWFLTGTYIGVLFVQNAMPQGFYTKRAPFLALLGRHSLLIYVIHQPVLYGIILVLGKIGWL